MRCCLKRTEPGDVILIASAASTMTGAPLVAHAFASRPNPTASENEAMTKWVETKRKSYCKSGIKYQVGYQPNPDPCATVTGTTTTTSQ